MKRFPWILVIGSVLVLLASPAGAQKSKQSKPQKKTGPVGPTKADLEAFEKKPFFATLTSKKGAYALGDWMDLTLKIKNVRMKKFKVVVPELSYMSVRFEIAYGKWKPFIYGRFGNNDMDPARARFDRLVRGKSEKARFRIPAVQTGPVRVTALYPDTSGEVFRSNTLELEVEGKAPLTAVIKMRGKKEIHLGFFPGQAPNTVTHFIDRVKDGFYDSLKFHRVVPGFVAQTGCPSGTGSGGPDYTIKGEFKGEKKHVRGALGMARVGGRDDSNGSQFYICLPTQGCANLNGKYTVFGKVIRGMDVVDDIEMEDVMESVKIHVAGKGKKSKKGKK